MQTIEIEILRAIQAIQNQAFDYIFVVLTMLGDTGFYIVTIPIIYWCISRSLGMRLGVTFLISMLGNDLLKEVVARSRPSSDAVRVLFAQSAGGYSFPSGHAQGAATYWGFLAAHFGQRWLRITAVVMALLIGLSRLYLGVHYPTDVLAGLGLGALFCFWGFERSKNWFTVHLDYVVKWQHRVSLILFLLFILMPPTEGIFKMTGAVMGLLSGHGLQERHLRFTEQTEDTYQLGKILLGIISLLALQQGLKISLGDAPWAGYVRYWVLTWCATFVVPWVFVKLGWSEKGV